MGKRLAVGVYTGRDPRRVHYWEAGKGRVACGHRSWGLRGVLNVLGVTCGGCLRTKVMKDIG